jgi:Kef-type K+ transport system membrane component KefB
MHNLLSLTPAALLAGESAVLPLLLALALLIAAAKLMGSLAVRIGQPAVLGELIAGLLLGPSVLNLFQLPIIAGEGLPDTISIFGQLGVIWLMFAAGLEVELSDLRASGRPAILAGTLGVVLPLGLGWLVAAAFGFPQTEAIFLGVTLSATSVSISAQTLLELGRLRTKEGVALLGAAVIDDLLVIITLSLFIVVVSGGGGPAALLAQLGQMLGVLVLVALLSLWLFPRIAEWAQRIPASEGLLAIVLAGVLFLAWAIEFLGGVAAITGAFLAGVGLGRSHLREEIEHGLHRIAYAFFVPLFLVDIGLQADLRALDPSALVFAGALILAAFISKLVGSGLGARLGGMDQAASLRMGLGMISRGEVGLIVAGVGVAEGILEPQLFSVLILMVLVTTLLTPPLLRWSFNREEAEDATAHSAGAA